MDQRRRFNITMKLVTSHWVKDVDKVTDYLKRWSFWLPFGWSLKLHKIVRADKDRCLHDHPWWFIRVIVYGGYIEQIKDKVVSRLPWRPWAFWRIYPCKPSFRHRIIKLYKKENWSLVLCGKNRGYWGFYTKQGWVPWEQFLDVVKTAVAWCKDN